GLFLAVGCIIAGLMKSYLGLIVGFGLLGGIGMGLGYAAATPAAVKWFHSSRRGLIVGLVVAGYGAAAVYISPLADSLIRNYALVFLFIGSAQSGLLVIANAKSFLTDAAGKTGFFAENAWLLVTFIGVVNALGRVGTGRYSDRIGRLNAYALNGLVSAACLLL